MRVVFEFATEDGKPLGHFIQTVTGAYPAGASTMYRVASAFGTSRHSDWYFIKGAWGWSFQSVTHGDGPNEKVPLPLMAGKTYAHRLGNMTIQGKVEGPVSVTVPAGTFQALLCTQEHEQDGETWTQKMWVAPKVGRVKFTVRADRMYTVSLARLEPPPQREVKVGTVVLSNFDSGAPLTPQLFPKTAWLALPQDGKALTSCEVDPINAANGTPMCLRWTFVKAEHWSNISIAPSGTWGKPADLSKYKGISFHARAFKPQEVVLQLAVGPWVNGNAVNKDVPLKLTTEWQRFEFDFARTPQLQGINWTEVYSIRFATWGKENNVVWVDEILLHTAQGL